MQVSPSSLACLRRKTEQFREESTRNQVDTVLTLCVADGAAYFSRPPGEDLLTLPPYAAQRDHTALVKVVPVVNLPGG